MGVEVGMEKVSPILPNDRVLPLWIDLYRSLGEGFDISNNHLVS